MFSSLLLPVIKIPIFLSILVVRRACADGVSDRVSAVPSQKHLWPFRVFFHKDSLSVFFFCKIKIEYAASPPPEMHRNNPSVTGMFQWWEALTLPAAVVGMDFDLAGSGIIWEDHNLFHLEPLPAWPAWIKITTTTTIKICMFGCNFLTITTLQP